MQLNGIGTREMGKVIVFTDTLEQVNPIKRIQGVEHRGLDIEYFFVNCSEFCYIPRRSNVTWHIEANVGSVHFLLVA